ncbi:mCG148328 [Mus musculus]|nr:mCG148328 [Mus musculus]
MARLEPWAWWCQNRSCLFQEHWDATKVTPLQEVRFQEPLSCYSGWDSSNSLNPNEIGSGLASLWLLGSSFIVSLYLFFLFRKRLVNFCFIYMYKGLVCITVCVPCVCSTHRGQEWVSDPLDLE